ncbi:protein JTB-like [Xenia sp. Carnegie-2017]|uniref:protein JTB-like n=1 Tax=Xenia sp. Carnegie-2017 TaxID=2897299 RepID=UPI001F041281|nr:protein JTB-like [Xenia sp. Carnegie-2017]
MSSKSSKSKFIFALIVMIIGLLILNLSLNVDLSKLVSFALASNTKALRGGNQTEDCSKVVLLEECQNCLKYQLESPSKYPECQESGQRQKNRCETTGEEFYSSCRTNEERKFWIFQITALILGLLSSSVVWCRSRHLDEHVLGKIRQQINGDT